MTDREETEIPYFTDPEKKTKKSLTDAVQPTSLGLNNEAGDHEETEPDILVNPPEQEDEDDDDE